MAARLGLGEATLGYRLLARSRLQELRGWKSSRPGGKGQLPRGLEDATAASTA